MTAAVVALAIALAGTTGGVVALTVWLRSALRGESKARDELRAEQVRAASITIERNEALARIKTLDSQLADATFRMLAAESMRDDLIKETAQHVADEIRSAPTAADALDRLNAELRKQAGLAPGHAATGGDRRPGDPLPAPRAPSAP